MIPEEKAEDLANRMYYVHGKIDSDMAIDCALIAVDEIFEAIDWHGYETPNAELLFWACVKNELLKMKS